MFYINIVKYFLCNDNDLDFKNKMKNKFNKTFIFTLIFIILSICFIYFDLFTVNFEITSKKIFIWYYLRIVNILFCFNNF